MAQGHAGPTGRQGVGGWETTNECGFRRLFLNQNQGNQSEGEQPLARMAAVARRVRSRPAGPQVRADARYRPAPTVYMLAQWFKRFDSKKIS